MQDFTILKRGGQLLWPSSKCLELLNASCCPCLHVEWSTAIRPQDRPKANIPNLGSGKACWQNRLKPVIHRKPKQQLSIGEKYQGLFFYLLGRGHRKCQEAATGKRKFRFVSYFPFGVEGRSVLVQMHRKSSFITQQSNPCWPIMPSTAPDSNWGTSDLKSGGQLREVKTKLKSKDK